MIQHVNCFHLDMPSFMPKFISIYIWNYHNLPLLTQSVSAQAFYTILSHLKHYFFIEGFILCRFIYRNQANCLYYYISLNMLSLFTLQLNCYISLVFELLTMVLQFGHGFYYLSLASLLNFLLFISFKSFYSFLNINVFKIWKLYLKKALTTILINFPRIFKIWIFDF